ncbi:hypothetical protein [Caloramator australicus]|uniref:Predicted membrane protein n=1 Tax=Caloramator australicus RC3 TaxID=857293 RepID=I7KSV0_9CLOT|nr:hypothetical protein [Caloramator australicus]CCJ32733.1 Predicted membrane protein [Caloramator australicus RC3]
MTNYLGVKTFFIMLAVDILIVLVTFFLFSKLIPGDKRHRIWEKYISSFSRFVIYLFLVTVIINVITALIVYSLRYQKYLNYIAPAVQSVLIGFIASCVPRRGVEEKKP